MHKMNSVAYLEKIQLTVKENLTAKGDCFMHQRFKDMQMKEDNGVQNP